MDEIFDFRDDFIGIGAFGSRVALRLLWTSDHTRQIYDVADVETRMLTNDYGGMAAGIDRMVMLLVGAKNLREVALFPMNQQANDLLMGAPSEVAPKQLRELHIRVLPTER